MARAGVDPELVTSMTEHYRFFQENLSDLCVRSAHMKVKDVMRPVEDSIDEAAPLSQAIHKMVLSHTLSTLVTRGSTVVGLIRLSDLFDEVAEHMRHAAD